MNVINKKYTILKEFIHSHFNLLLRSDGIVQFNTTEDAYFTVKEAKDFVIALEGITGGIPHLILKVPGSHASLDSGARTFMAKPEALQFSIAEAVIIKSLAQRIIGNFYLRFDKPGKTIRFFEKQGAAEKWLKSLV